VTRTDYPDHHWFTPDEAARERQRARRDGAHLLLTAKDAVRWPAAGVLDALVLEVAWEWVAGGDAVEARVREALAGAPAGVRA
jgi:tetraacyldisaccharide-1-P 4'-kinase